MQKIASGRSGADKCYLQGAGLQPSPNLRIATVGKARLRLAKQGAGHEAKCSKYRLLIIDYRGSEGA
jgi:hypothetical protein